MSERSKHPWRRTLGVSARAVMTASVEALLLPPRRTPGEERARDVLKAMELKREQRRGDFKRLDTGEGPIDLVEAMSTEHWPGGGEDDS